MGKKEKRIVMRIARRMQMALPQSVARRVTTVRGGLMVLVVVYGDVSTIQSFFVLS